MRSRAALVTCALHAVLHAPAAWARVPEAADAAQAREGAGWSGSPDSVESVPADAPPSVVSGDDGGPAAVAGDVAIEPALAGPLATPGERGVSGGLERGVLTVGVIAGGGDGNGPSFGLRAGVGARTARRLRLDLVATGNGSTATSGELETTVGRLSVELVASTAMGRARPFAGVGLQRANVSVDFSGAPTDACVPGTIICLPGDWREGSFEAERVVSGPVASAGVLFRAGDRVLLGVEVRKAFLRDALGTRLGAPAGFASLTWRFAPVGDDAP